MRRTASQPSPTWIRAAVWLAGLAALLGGGLFWALGAHPYEAPWAWISFIGMCIIDDYLLGPGAEAAFGQLPRITLLAAIIVFRRHPEITLLVALVAAPLAGLLKGQRPAALLTGTAQWIIAAVVGAAAFRAVGFETTPRFVAATVALVALYYLLGPVLSGWLDACLSPTAFPRAFRQHRRFALTLEIVGVFLAMAWRTAALQPAALKLADGALVALAGVASGTLLQGRPAWLFRSAGRIPQKAAVAAGALLLLGLLAPNPFSWILPLTLAIIAGIWAARREAYSILCCAVGAFCNELVRAANGGFMPVEGSGLMSGFGAANTYVKANPHTALAWLDDRLLLPPPFPGIASAGDLLIAVGMAWLVATVVVRRRAGTAPAVSDGDLPLEAAA